MGFKEIVIRVPDHQDIEAYKEEETLCYFRISSTHNVSRRSPVTLACILSSHEFKQ
jgi:hypothetical protein